jgi:hypothetical protein
MLDHYRLWRQQLDDEAYTVSACGCAEATAEHAGAGRTVKEEPGFPSEPPYWAKPR